MTEDERCEATRKFVMEMSRWTMLQRMAAVGFIGEHVAWDAKIDPIEFFKVLMDCCEERKMGLADGKVH
jgi:hypothetical protein